MREYDVVFISSFVQIFEMEATQSQNRQHSNSFFVFVQKKGLITKKIQFTNILLTGNSNNIVFTLFLIMNKMSVGRMLPILLSQNVCNIHLLLFLLEIYAFLGASYD